MHWVGVYWKLTVGENRHSSDLFCPLEPLAWSLCMTLSTSVFIFMHWIIICWTKSYVQGLKSEIHPIKPRFKNMCFDLCCIEMIPSSRWSPNTGSNTCWVLCGPEEIGQQSPPHSWVPRLIGKIDIVYVFTHHPDCVCLGPRLYLNRSGL